MDGYTDMGFFDLLATVSGSSRPEPGHRHSRYAIEVVVPGSNRAWTIQRRYHEFKRLYNALYVVAFPGPRLPPRQLWGPRTKTMLERRAESLDMWLQGTLAVWKSFYAPGDDEASVTVTSLLIVFLCRDQEFIVSHALGQYTLSTQSALDLTGNTPPQVGGAPSSEPILRQMSSAAEQGSSSSSHGDAIPGAGSTNGKIHRFVHRMSRRIKSLFSVDVSGGIMVARGDSDASLRRSSGGTSPRHSPRHVTFSERKPPISPSTRGTIGLPSGGGWLQRGRMMFRRNSSKTKLASESTSFGRKKMSSRKSGSRSQGDDEEMLHRMFMEDSGPIISPTEEGSVHRVYADDPSHHHQLEQQQAQEANSTDVATLNASSNATTSILAAATGVKKQSPQRITFNEVTTEVEDSVHGGEGKISHGNLRKVISMTDDDGSELEWVFDSEEDEEEGELDDSQQQHSKSTRKRGISDCDPLFLGDVVEYIVLEGQEEKKPLEQLFQITLQVPTTGGIDVLRHGYGMVSVPPSPRAREVFKRPWKAYTDKLLFHVQRRLEQTTNAAITPTPRSRASSGDGDWIDSGSEEGGSEAGGDDENKDGVFAQRTRWLQDTFRETHEEHSGGALITDGAGSEYEDGYDSEGWASEAANESYDGGNDREVFGSWEEGTLWIGPKREPPPNLAAESCDSMPGSVLNSARNSYADDEEEEEEDDNGFDSNEYSDEDEEANSEEENSSDSDYSHDSSFTDENADGDEYSDEQSTDGEQEESSHHQQELTLKNENAVEATVEAELAHGESTTGIIPILPDKDFLDDEQPINDMNQSHMAVEHIQISMVDVTDDFDSAIALTRDGKDVVDTEEMEPDVAVKMDVEKYTASVMSNRMNSELGDECNQNSIIDLVAKENELKRLSDDVRMTLTIHDGDIGSTKDGILEEKS